MSICERLGVPPEWQEPVDEEMRQTLERGVAEDGVLFHATGAYAGAREQLQYLLVLQGMDTDGIIDADRVRAALWLLSQFGKP